MCIWRSFLRRMRIAPEVPGLIEEWRILLDVRDRALKVLEGERKRGQIGKALEAKVMLEVDSGTTLCEFLLKHETDLKELMNVSDFKVEKVHGQHGAT